MGSFLEHFATLPDRRVDRTKQHKLCDIIFVTISAVLSGCDDWNEIELYGKEKEQWLRNYLELPHGIPTHDTFNRVFAALDPEALKGCFLSWVQSVAQLSEGTLVSIDGKRLCNSGVDGKRSIVHMVSAWSEANQLMLANYQVEDKTNEITAIPAILEVLELKGCIVSLDAMGCQREIAAQIIDKGAEYILAVKENQGFLPDDIQEAFAHSTQISSDVMLNVGHGRVERRQCRIVQEPEWVCKGSKWKGVQTLIEISAERTDKSSGQRSTELRYYISSLVADAAVFNRLVRSHWGIENSLHWTLDVVFQRIRARRERVMQRRTLP